MIYNSNSWNFEVSYITWLTDNKLRNFYDG